MSDRKNIRVIIESLVTDLASEDGIVRTNARRRLVAYKSRSVAPLIKALRNKSDYVRWEAAKALGQIGSPASIQALLRALEDNMFDVR